ncbi:hypothetical protein BGX29_012351 [Mortierella sp. GBA35]|nr:hypothetical protein BGX29_012351 [Mortierella sp. GBA35]
MANDQPATTDTYFQTFRSGRDKGNIRIPVVRHPTLGELYVIWTDITDCFPGATRIQYDNVFIPMLRDKRCYRVKPHGIRYHPGIILDVIYGEKATRRTTKNRSSSSSNPVKNSTKEGPGKETGADVVSSNTASSTLPNGVTSTGQATLTEDADHGDEDEHDGDELDDDEDDKVAAQKKARTIPHKDADGGLASQTVQDKGVMVRASVSVLQSNKDAGTSRTTGNKKSSTPPAAPVALSRQELSTKSTAELLAAAAATAAAAGKKPVSIAEQKSALASIFELYKRALPHKRAPREGPLLVSDLVEHRVKNILNSRFAWSQSKHSKYFCFLPIEAERPVGASPPAAEADGGLGDPYIRFHIYYICDCGDIPGFESRWYPHWNIKDGESHHLQAAGESLGYQQLDALVPFVGEYIMGVLEMLKYGVYVDNVVRFPAQMSAEAQRRISLAIEFLESRGILSCEKYLAELKLESNDVTPEAALEGLKPIAPLDEKMSSEFRKRTVKHRWEKYDELNPYRTAEGDIRWVCLAHWYDMSPQDEWVLANQFSKNRASVKSTFKTAQGSFSSEIHNMERAREFFELAGQLTTTSVFRLSLMWDLTHEDETEISRAVCQLRAAALHLTVRAGTGMQGGAPSGFEKGFLYLIMSSLKNPFLEVFRLMQTSPRDDNKYPVNDERFNVSSSTFSPDTLAIWKRPTKDDRIKAILRATNIDWAASSVRRLSKGFRNFSELRLLIETVWREVTIKFADPASGLPGSDVTDKDPTDDDIVTFFRQREWCDKVVYYCADRVDSGFLETTCLTHVRIEASLAEDRAKIRNLIRNNSALKSLQLENPDKDDPSQIYESCKAVLATHPSIELFEIRHLHHTKTPSTFAWSNPNDPAKMRVRITCFEGDKVQAMFQKYAPLIEQLWIDQLQQSDSAALEKSMRTRKGPMALRQLQINNVHLMDSTVLEDLRKIIVRSDIQNVRVSGDVLLKRCPPDHEADGSELALRRMNKNVNNKLKGGEGNLASSVESWADFLVSIRSKITALSLWGKGMSKVLKALGARMDESIHMPLLHELTLTGDWDQSLFKFEWLRALLYRKQPQDRKNSHIFLGTPYKLITLFHVSGAVIAKTDWFEILCLLDFTQMTQFQVEQRNQLLPELYSDILSVLPEDSPTLSQFTVDDDRSVDAEEVLQYEDAIRARTSKHPILVMINGYALS